MKKQSGRYLALETLLDCEEKNLFVNQALAASLARVKLSEKERALCTELVNGCMRMRKKIDWFIAQFTNRSLDKLSPKVLNILRLACYQKLFLTRIPDYALVNEAVDMTKAYEKAASSFVNAVLRNFLQNYKKIELPTEEENPINFLALKYSFPDWLIDYWCQHFTHSEIRAICEANNQPAPLTVRVNTLLTTQAELIAILAKEEVTAKMCRYAPCGLFITKTKTALTSLKSFQEGLFTIQSESSMLVSLLLAPAKDSLVFDFCAGRGGKTTHLAQIMENSGKIVAFENGADAAKSCHDAVRRLQLKNVVTEMADLTESNPHWENQADYIMVDAPCSGLGALRRYSDLRWQKSLATIKQVVELQAKIMDTAASYLKPGGRIVYAVCTNTFEENELLISSFLNQHSQFELESLTGVFPTQFKKITHEKIYFKTRPDRDNLDGFFAVRLKKKGN